MKKSRIMLVVVLAIVLCVTCIISPTFSWNTRPREQSGNSLKWDSEYEISNGEGIAMQTLISADGGKTYTEEVSSFNETSVLAAGNSKYYRTEISNSSDSAQSVSLFLSQLDLSQNVGGKFYLGVNGPLRTYKGYGYTTTTGGQSVAEKVDKQNVYIGLHSDEISDLTSHLTSGYIHGWSNSGGIVSDCSWSNVTDTGKTGTWNVGYWSGSQTFRIYAAQIQYACTNFMMYTDYGWMNDAQPAISSNNTILYFEYGGTGTSSNYHVSAVSSSQAAGIDTFYSSASIEAGSSLNLAAVGRNITYKSSNTNIATVASDGTVTVKSTATANQTVTITATSTGVYGDTITSDCVVTVAASEITSGFDIPIVTNYKIAAETDGVATTEYVYWYIKNDSSSALTYSLSDIYLSL